MPSTTGFNWNHRYEYFDSLTEKELFELARNPSVPIDNRLLMVEIGLKKGYRMRNHPELSGMCSQFDGKIEIEEIPDEPEVPFAASVTTKTMSEVQKMDNDSLPPANEAPISTKLNEKDSINE